MGQPPICSYEGSDYRTRFWENQDRSYEDRVERIALKRLLPPEGETLIDIGAGFGRLASEFHGYENVVLFDYSRSLLREAQSRLGSDQRFKFVAGNWYKMPFVSGLFETMVQVRTIHHAADVPALFSQLVRIARPKGRYILEFASKHHLKAIARYLMRRQDWSPFKPDPIEFAELNYDFHPQWIREQLGLSGFKPGRMLTVSHYRVPFIKKLLPIDLLVAMDRIAQLSGNWWQLTPSVFIRSQSPSFGEPAIEGTFFACPECQSILDHIAAEHLSCPNAACGRRWAVVEGLYDFKDPV